MAASTSEERRSIPRIRLPADRRRQLIVEAAFAVIAASGFEGLRTRDIAAKVGINIATLHHHFPTKEDLIGAVAVHLEHRFRTERAPATRRAEPPSAYEALEAQFADFFFYREGRPELLAVYREFSGRATRDETARAILERLHDGWRESLLAILSRGAEDGSLRSDLNAGAGSEVVLRTLWGFIAPAPVSSTDLTRALGELLKWLRPG